MKKTITKLVIPLFCGFFLNSAFVHSEVDGDSLAEKNLLEPVNQIELPQLMDLPSGDSPSSAPRFNNYSQFVFSRDSQFLWVNDANPTPIGIYRIHLKTGETTKYEVARRCD